MIRDSTRRCSSRFFNFGNFVAGIRAPCLPWPLPIIGSPNKRFPAAAKAAENKAIRRTIEPMPAKPLSVLRSRKRARRTGICGLANAAKRRTAAVRHRQIITGWDRRQSVGPARFATVGGKRECSACAGPRSRWTPILALPRSECRDQEDTNAFSWPDSPSAASNPRNRRSNTVPGAPRDDRPTTDRF